MHEIELTGSGLSPVDAVRTVRDTARERCRVLLAAEAQARMQASADAVARASLRQPVYGRTTGVGANRDVFTDDPAHGARLLASHSTTGTVPYPAEVARLGVLIRVNQLAVGGSGLNPRVADAILDLVNTDRLPDLHRGAAIGTGDLGALAELGLALGDVVDGQSALPLLSSNALTLAECCLAFVDVLSLVDVAPVVAAVTHVAMGGNVEAYDARVHAARPMRGQQQVAEQMRRLLGGVPSPARRIQDPFGLRAFPQVLGPAHHHIAVLEEALTIDINSATENPLVADDTILHHGNWHAMPIALALDAVRLSLHSVATLSTSRLANLVDPEFTGQSRFLASGHPANSGVMIIEYVAHDALAGVRSAAQPATLGTATLSRGAEHHASFAPQATALTADLVDSLRTVLACELVAASRAVRLSGVMPHDLAPAAIADTIEHAFAVLPAELEDRSLREDVRVARALLTEWGEEAL
jgi:histidine ammonia-lyase